jgi:hypothetical protein
MVRPSGQFRTWPSTTPPERSGALQGGCAALARRYVAGVTRRANLRPTRPAWSRPPTTSPETPGSLSAKERVDDQPAAERGGEAREHERGDDRHRAELEHDDQRKDHHDHPAGKMRQSIPQPEPPATATMPQPASLPAASHETSVEGGSHVTHQAFRPCRYHCRRLDSVTAF